MSDPGDGEGPLARWSRRKASARREQSSPPGEAVVDTEMEADAVVAEPAKTLTDEEALEKFDLPDPDSLKEGDDFSRFMGDGVPDALRRRALRQLWRVNPTLANLDGLVDYGEDYTDAATVVGALSTAYRVGRGFLSDEEVERQHTGMGASKDTTEADDAVGLESEDGALGEKVVDDGTAPRDGDVSSAASEAPEKNLQEAIEGPEEVSRGAAQKLSDEGFRSAIWSAAPPKARRMKFRLDEN